MRFTGEERGGWVSGFVGGWIQGKEVLYILRCSHCRSKNYCTGSWKVHENAPSYVLRRSNCCSCCTLHKGSHTSRIHVWPCFCHFYKASEPSELSVWPVTTTHLYTCILSFAARIASVWSVWCTSGGSFLQKCNLYISPYKNKNKKSTLQWHFKPKTEETN